MIGTPTSGASPSLVGTMLRRVAAPTMAVKLGQSPPLCLSHRMPNGSAKLSEERYRSSQCGLCTSPTHRCSTIFQPTTRRVAGRCIAALLSTVQTVHALRTRKTYTGSHGYLCNSLNHSSVLKASPQPTCRFGCAL